MPCVIDTANNETLKTQTNQMNNNNKKTYHQNKASYIQKFTTLCNVYTFF